MFGKVLKAELKRSCSPIRMFAAICCFVGATFASIWDIFTMYFDMMSEERMRMGSIIKFLSYLMSQGSFKLVCVLALCMLYTGSFCSDDEHRYLRMILNRTDPATYTQCRFISNLFVITATSIGAVFAFTGMMKPFFPATSANLKGQYYYEELIIHMPYLYIFLMGLEFGLATAACSSIGLLFSAYQANKFVSIGLGGFVFYLAFSYVPSGSFISMLDLILMLNLFPQDWNIAWQVNLAWGILYPILIVALCGILFYRKLKRRMSNGTI